MEIIVFEGFWIKISQHVLNGQPKTDSEVCKWHMSPGSQGSINIYGLYLKLQKNEVIWVLTNHN